MKKITKKYGKRTVLATVFSTVFFIALLGGVGAAFAYTNNTITGSGYNFHDDALSNSNTYYHNINITPSAGIGANIHADKVANRKVKTSFYSYQSSTGRIWAHLRNSRGSVSKSESVDLGAANTTYEVFAETTNATVTVAHTCHYTQGAAVQGVAINVTISHGE